MKKFSGIILFSALFMGVCGFAVDTLLILYDGEKWAHADERNYRVVRGEDGQFTYQIKRRGALFPAYGWWFTDSLRFQSRSEADRAILSELNFSKDLMRSARERKRKDWVVVP